MHISVTLSVTERDKGTTDIISISVSESSMAVSTAELLHFITSEKHLAELYESAGSGYCLKAQCQPV